MALIDNKETYKHKILTGKCKYIIKVVDESPENLKIEVVKITTIVRDA